MRHVRDRDPQPPGARRQRLHADRVVVIARIRGVDGEKRQVAKVEPAGQMLGAEPRLEPGHLLERRLREDRRQAPAPDQRAVVGLGRAGRTQHLDDAALGGPRLTPRPAARSLRLRAARRDSGQHQIAGAGSAQLARADRENRAGAVAPGGHQCQAPGPLDHADPGLAPPLEHAHDLGLARGAQRLEQHPVAGGGVTRLCHLPDAAAVLLDLPAGLVSRGAEGPLHEAVAAAQAVARAEPVETALRDQLLEQASQRISGSGGKLQRAQQRRDRERGARAPLQRAQHRLGRDGRLRALVRASPAAAPGPRVRIVSVHAAAGQARFLRSCGSLRARFARLLARPRAV
jgi:hypothetical protein